MSDNEDFIHEIFEENDVVAVENIGDVEATEPIPANNEGEGENDDDKTTVKPKRIIRNPQPRLNAETLKGKRGLTALPSYFERVKFKGKGYEEQDLGMILKTYEYWCHRLFPKYPFDECVAKIENLGKKRPVVTHIKRIRTDLICEDEPIINDNHDSDTEQMPDNVFDDLLQPPIAHPSSIQVSNTQISSMEPPAGITEEQMERMRLNKERAERIRRERLRQTMEFAQSSRENDEIITRTESSQLHSADSHDYQEENGISDVFFSHRDETDLDSTTNWMNSSQPRGNSTQAPELSQQTNAKKRTTKMNSIIDSEDDVETNSQEENSSVNILRTSTELDQERKSQKRPTKISSINDSDVESDNQPKSFKKRLTKINTIIDSDEDMETNSQEENNSDNMLRTSTELDPERNSQKRSTKINSFIDSDDDVAVSQEENTSPRATSTKLVQQQKSSKRRPTKINSIIDSDEDL